MSRLPGLPTFQRAIRAVRTPRGAWIALYLVSLLVGGALLLATRPGDPLLAWDAGAWKNLARDLGLLAVAALPLTGVPIELFVRRQAAPSRDALGMAVFRLWLVNVVVATLVGSLWLFQTPPDASPWIRVYVALALVASVALISLVPGAGFLLTLRWLRGWRSVAAAVSFIGALYLALLYTDTIVYRLLRYHFFSSAVVNVALTEGSGDSIILGSYVWTSAAAAIGVMGTAQFLLLGAFVRRLVRLEEEGRRPHFLLQPKVVVTAGVLPPLLFSQSVYAAADLSGDREVLRATRPIPVVPRVRLGRVLDPTGERTPELDLLPEGARLDWPAAPPRIDPTRGAAVEATGKLPNICIVVLDSWRRDMFDPELTPALWQFSTEARRYNDHLSGGNGTRYGLFTMFYGLHGSYWFPVLEERRSPVLIDTLQSLGYDLRVFSSASMSFPEFRDTAWVGLEESQVLDEFGDDLVSWQKDELLAETFSAWQAERTATGDDRPFFSFLLIDAPHQPYDNPGGPYEPAVESLDYIELGRTTEGPALAKLQERVLNAYRNSVHHADETAGSVLAALEREGVLDDTLVLVTGDHGEEFFECGFWGHTSAFSPEQVEVPFMLRGPGVEPGVETRPTSHLDVSNSLLELLGADPAGRADYSLGMSLFDPPATRSRVLAGWSDLGLWTPSGIFDIPLRAPSAAGWGEELECYDRHWNPVPDLEVRLRRERHELERMAEECLRFLRDARR